VDTLYPCCAGLDVHKQVVVACVRKPSPGGRVRCEVRTFRTETNALLEMADWLTDEGVTVVAMESTGVYWKPVFNILEGHFSVLLANPQHLRRVPGRKTDVKDSEWIAHLLQHGLLKPSFVPEKPVRQLRDLTRQRTQLTRQKVQVANRIQKTLEDANVKLGSVASDVLGASGRDMLKAMIAGESDPIVLADLARQRLRVVLVQCAWAASRAVGTHLRQLYGRLVGRRGKKRALVAVAHRLLVIVYNVLKKGQAYEEPVPAAPDRHDRERLKQKLIRRLQRLGVKVQEAQAVA